MTFLYKIPLMIEFGKLGFRGGSEVKASASNAGDLGLIPGLGRFPWRRERLLTLVSWPREFHGLHSPLGRKESDTTERLSFHFHALITFLLDYLYFSY